MSKRIKTTYPGVFYREGKRAGGGVEKIYYIVFKQDGKVLEEKVGRQYQDNMTPAKASRIRAERMEGRRQSRKEIRQEQAAKEAGTISQLWEVYKENRPDLKSVAADDHRFRFHLKKPFGNKAPSDILTLDVDRMRIRLLKNRKPATVRNVLELLRRIINFGVNKGLCPPIDPRKLKFEFPRVDNEVTEDLTPDQLARLLKVLDEDRNQQIANMMKLALFSGMRRGELFKLKWADVDFERGFIHIVDPKGGKSQTIPMSPPARELLENHERTDSPFVFPGRGGNQRVCVRKPVARIRDKAGLPKGFRPIQGLRHVYASMLSSSGKVDMYTLQKLMTHKSAVMTARYAHLRDEALQRAGNVVGDMFAGIGSEKKKVVNLDDFRDDS